MARVRPVAVAGSIVGGLEAWRGFLVMARGDSRFLGFLGLTACPHVFLVVYLSVREDHGSMLAW